MKKYFTKAVSDMSDTDTKKGATNVAPRLEV